MRTLVFDRFESDRESGPAELARDLADLLGARRTHERSLPGILNWGLPGAAGMTPASSADCERIAGWIRDAIRRHEPRLEHVRVTPTEDTSGFAFYIEAHAGETGSGSVRLRVLSPRIGGGLGSEVVVLEDR